jgi:hypothetical protein
LVEPDGPSEFSEYLETGELREDVERLVEALIEILDIADGDVEAEPNGDELEDDQG